MAKLSNYDLSTAAVWIDLEAAKEDLAIKVVNAVCAQIITERRERLNPGPYKWQNTIGVPGVAVEMAAKTFTDAGYEVTFVASSHEEKYFVPASITIHTAPKQSGESS